MVRWNEEVIQRELVAGGAAQADRVPDVGPFDVLGSHQHGALQRHAVGFQSGSAVGRKDRTMRAEPGRVPTTGGKGPHARDPVAALAFDRADLGPGTPGQYRARIPEDRARHRQIEIGRRHRTAAGLAEAPGRGRIGLGDGFNDMEEGDGIGFDPVGRARQQQTKQLRVVQPVEQRRRQPARTLNVVSGCRHIGTNSLGTGDDRPVTGKVGSSRDQIIQASIDALYSRLCLPDSRRRHIQPVGQFLVDLLDRLAPGLEADEIIHDAGHQEPAAEIDERRHRLCKKGIAGPSRATSPRRRGAHLRRSDGGASCRSAQIGTSRSIVADRVAVHTRHLLKVLRLA